MCLAASIIGCQFWELIGCLSMAIGWAPGSNVDDSLDGAYLGPFTEHHNKYELPLKLTRLLTVIDIFPLVVVEKCQHCQLCLRFVWSI